MRIVKIFVVLGAFLFIASSFGAFPHYSPETGNQAFQPATSSNTYVLLVHGYAVADTGGTPTSTPFTSGVNVYNQLVSEGYIVGLVSYYGTFTVTFSNGYTYTNSNFQGTANTPIQDISYQLGDFITSFSSGQHINLDIVAHSMGGLVTMYMLEHFTFPNVNLENVIFIASPFGGSPFASVAQYLGLGWYVGTEAYQMVSGSSFLNDLHNNLGNAYSNFGHTTWIAYAGNYDPWWGYLFFSGDNDGVVSVNSAFDVSLNHVYVFGDIHTSSLDWLTWDGVSYFEDQSVANEISYNLAGYY